MINLKLLVKIVSLILLSVEITSFVSPAQAQNRNQPPVRIIEKGNKFNPPVDIVLIRSKLGRIEANKGFSADEEWFKGLTVRLQNISNKPVNYVSISVRFPRPEEDPEKLKNERKKLDFIFPLEYGKSPIPTVNGEVLNNTATPILPGESVEIGLSDNDYNNVRNALAESGFPPNINRMRVYISSVGFTDGSIWMGGQILHSRQI